MAGTAKQKPDAVERDPSPESFGTRLAAAMRQKGWTLAQTAHEVSRRLPDGETFNPVNLSHYVHGRSQPRPRYLKALIEALDLTDVPVRPESTIPRQRPAAASSQLAKNPNGLVRVEDVGDGSAILELKQRVPWPVALKILDMLKCNGPN